MSIHKDKKRNTWYVKYHNHTKRGFTSKKEAKDYELNLKAGIQKPHSRKKKHKFSDLAMDFLKHRKEELAYTSYSMYEYIVLNTIIPFFKIRMIEDIDEIDCRDFKVYINRLSYSINRKNRVIHLFKNIFLYANDYYGVSSNPTVLMKTFNRKFEEAINKKNIENSIWTVDEFNEFIKYVYDERYKALFITLFFTGLRLGEALALTFNDLYPNHLSITKSQTKKCENGKYAIKAPKNVSSIRDVSINQALYNYLLTIKRKQEKEVDYNPSWFIFWGKDPLSRTSIERIKNNAVKEAKVKKIRIHDFRHSHASNLIGEGMDIVAVSKRLGHSTVEMTLSVYTHLLNKNNEKIVDYLENSSHNLLTDE